VAIKTTKRTNVWLLVDRISNLAIFWLTLQNILVHLILQLLFHQIRI